MSGIDEAPRKRLERYGNGRRPQPLETARPAGLLGTCGRQVFYAAGSQFVARGEVWSTVDIVLRGELFLSHPTMTEPGRSGIEARAGAILAAPRRGSELLSPYTVTARTNVELLRIDDHELLVLLVREPETGRAILDKARDLYKTFRCRLKQVEESARQGRLEMRPIPVHERVSDRLRTTFCGRARRFSRIAAPLRARLHLERRDKSRLAA